MRNLLLFPMIFFFSTMTFAADINLEGTYTCKGYDPNYNSHFTNYFSVKKINDHYSIRGFDNEGTTSHGTGIVKKDIFMTKYQNVFQKEYTGVIIYKIASDGSLHGTWTQQKSKKIGTIDCRKQ